jgi:hypothetical protein
VHGYFLCIGYGIQEKNGEDEGYDSHGNGYFYLKMAGRPKAARRQSIFDP